MNTTLLPGIEIHQTLLSFWCKGVIKMIFVYMLIALFIVMVAVGIWWEYKEFLRNPYPKSIYF